MMDSYSYTTIKYLAKQVRQQHVKCQVTDLIALAAQNDPFYCGTDADVKNGTWFATLWERFGFSQGVHLRRIHYQIISQKTPVLMPDGTPYENTMRCWNFLEQASKTARYLEYVSPDSFVDRRNPDPHVFLEHVRYDPEVYVSNELDWWDFRCPAFPSLPSYVLSNYGAPQRYHLEVWCEKSTMNDVLIPLCQQYGANLVTGVGEQSITSTIQLVQRAMEIGKPVRVFYVSDFDPAGRSMPVAVARKAEYYIRKLDPSLDFRVFPVVLTKEQCRQYELPRTPIKDSERRKGHFEKQHGEGATELDALEALHPGTLRNILAVHLLEYYDTTLQRRVDESRRSLESELYRREDALLDDYDRAVSDLRQAHEEMEAEFTAKMNALRERIEPLWDEMRDVLARDMPDAGAFSVPEAQMSAESLTPLFDSQRTYLEQLAAYKHFQGKKNGIRGLQVEMEVN